MNIISEISTLREMFQRDIFSKHIYYIRFPKFRNLEPNSKITFDFPITFFVGKNGGGKSSTLQSLYGTPLNYSLSDFWFSTAIDPIKDLKDDRNCFIYGYKLNNVIVEVLKQRAQRKNKLDYWEPSKPIKKYDMDTTSRYSPVERNVVYVDFRSELSAFDSFLYIMPFSPTSTIKSKQDFIRRYSGKIKEAFDSGKVIQHFGKTKNKPVTSLTGEEINAVSFILGKKYNSIEILEHSFLKNSGFSVRFTSAEFKYSEAFAGSGETAIIVLIHKIHNCENNSLILLDEPETSLHFGAQKRLMYYLLNQTKRKHLQIVISTHSPFFLENMPADSIKVFSTNNVGLFHIENRREAREAHIELEIDNSNEKVQILVEDKLARNIINKILEKMGADIKASFNIKYLPGGASSLKQRMAYSLDYVNLPYVIFDGDQKKVSEHIDLDSLPNNQIDTYTKLSELLKIQTDSSINFFTDGGNNDNEQQKIDLIKKYFVFYKNNVFYLPLNIPEDIIWCDVFALKKLKDIKGHDNLILPSIKTGNSKVWFLNLCKELYNDVEHLDTLHTEFIINWINKTDENYNNIVDLLNKLRDTK